MKNVELADRGSERQTEHSDFIRPLFKGIQYTKETSSYLSFEYIPDL